MLVPARKKNETGCCQQFFLVVACFFEQTAASKERRGCSTDHAVSTTTVNLRAHNTIFRCCLLFTNNHKLYLANTIHATTYPISKEDAHFDRCQDKRRRRGMEGDRRQGAPEHAGELSSFSSRPSSHLLSSSCRRGSMISKCDDKYDIERRDLNERTSPHSRTGYSSPSSSCQTTKTGRTRRRPQDVFRSCWKSKSPPAPRKDP